jgi:hypothetical protein
LKGSAAAIRQACTRASLLNCSPADVKALSLVSGSFCCPGIVSGDRPCHPRSWKSIAPWAWTDESAASVDFGGLAVRAQIFDAGGRKLGREFVVNRTTANDQHDPAVAIFGDTRFVVVWTGLEREAARQKPGRHPRPGVPRHAIRRPI